MDRELLNHARSAALLTVTMSCPYQEGYGLLDCFGMDFGTASGFVIVTSLTSLITGLPCGRLSIPREK